MNKLSELSDIALAQDIAMYTHAGQKRKASGKPYYIHPFRTYQLAKKMNLSKKAQILSILHDTYEDSSNRKYTIKEIEKRFGSKIANTIKLLSHEKGIEYNDYLLKLSKKSKLAFNVKLIDMIDNILDKPNKKQLEKYRVAIKWLNLKGINIPSNIKTLLFTLLGF